MKYPVLILAAAALIAAVPDPTPPPSPPPLNTAGAATAAPASTPLASPSPIPTPTLNLDTILASPAPSRHGRHGDRNASRATPKPPPQRTGLDGVWEIQIQRGANVEYEHMTLTQIGQTITGTYLVAKTHKKYPVNGELDAQNNVRLIVSLPDGSTILLEGRVDGTTDMLGMFTDAKERVPFTAAYRPKEKFIDNINAQPGGLGSP